METGDQFRKRLAAEIRQAKRNGTWKPPRLAKHFFKIDDTRLPKNLLHAVGLKKAYFLSKLIERYNEGYENGWLELDESYPKHLVNHTLDEVLKSEEIDDCEEFFQEKEVLQISKHKLSDEDMYRINIDRIQELYW